MEVLESGGGGGREVVENYGKCEVKEGMWWWL